MAVKYKSKNGLFINAIAWKANVLGISYGKLLIQLSNSEIEQIVTEYEKRIAAQKETEAARVNVLKKQAEKQKGA